MAAKRGKRVVSKIYRYIRAFQKMLKEANVSAHASSAAYFLFLSIIPIIMIICALLQHAPEVQMKLWSYISQAIIPDRVADFLQNIINVYQGNSITLVSVSAVVAIWSASKGMLSLIRGMNSVYEIKESRNYLLLRLRALIYTIFLLLSILLSIILLVFGNKVAGLFLPRFEIIGQIWDWLQPLRHILVACVISVIFCTFYCLLPNNRLPWREQFPGAVFTSVFWTLYSFFFSVYIDYFNGYSMYGSLTTVIIVMIWLYFCMYIFFCGALVNRFWEMNVADDIQRFLDVHESERKTAAEKIKETRESRNSS